MNLLRGIENLESVFPAQGGWLKMRQDGQKKFADMGLPTRKSEEWHYTNVKEISDAYFQPSILQKKPLFADVESQIKAGLSPQFTNIVFLNGFLDSNLSNFGDLGQGVAVVELASMVGGKQKNENHAMIEELSKKYFQGVDPAFQSLNDSFVGQGVVVEIAANVAVKKPIHIHFYSTLDGGAAHAVHPKIFLSVGENSSVDFAESYSGQTGARYFVNSSAKIALAKNAHLRFCQIQNDSLLAFCIKQTQIFLHQDAKVDSVTMSLGSRLLRNNFNVYHLGKNSFAKVNGISLLSGSQHIDQHTHIEHFVGECESQQKYKNILNQKSRAVFNGRIFIHEGADKANCEQLSSNLLLSSEAEVDTKPELIVHADDVKAGHGASVGQLDPEEIFYFQSRGIERNKAIELLSIGFASDLIYQVANSDISQWMLGHLTNKMQQEIL